MISLDLPIATIFIYFFADLFRNYFLECSLKTVGIELQFVGEMQIVRRWNSREFHVGFE